MKKNGEFKKSQLIVRLIVSSALVIILINTILNTFWLKIMYDKAFWALLSTRIIKEVIMLPIQVVTMLAIIKSLKPVTKKYLID